MERWAGKIAVVTGTSVGIGAAVALDLAKAGLVVVGLSRRVELVDELSKQLDGGGTRGKLVSHFCDVRDNQSVIDAFDWIEREHGLVSIVVNNAGIVYKTAILDDDNDHLLNDIIATNLMGVIHSTKAAYRHMAKSNDFGHIINMNSTTGHSVPHVTNAEKTWNLYPSSKHAMTAYTEVLQQELFALKNNKVRVSSISGGLTATGIYKTGGFDVSSLAGVPLMKASDISNAIIYILSVPPEVVIYELKLKATGQYFNAIK